MRIAGIDLGTNTILMLIADVSSKGTIIPVADFHAIARLGERVNKTSEISPQALDRAIQILKDYKLKTIEHNVEKIYCVGTSALRDAKNSQWATDIIKNEVGISVDVISGELEALLSFRGTVEDTSYSVVLDIGGGSTEIIIGENESITFRNSFNFGVVKLTEKYISVHPPSKENIDAVKNDVEKKFREIEKKLIQGRVYAVAGTPTTIAQVVQGLKEYDRTKVDNFILKLDDIIYVRDLFISMSIEEMISKLNIPPLRADVITAGAIILETFCKCSDIDKLIVSDKGLRYGVVKYFAIRS